MEPKTMEEMKTLAKELFGEGAYVTYNDGWIIETGVEERFEEEKYVDRDAYALYCNWEGGENQLERWAYKNGHSGESMAQIFDSYDEEQEASARRIVREVRDHIEKGLDFKAAGLEDWRDRVLTYAEEKGW